jgi:hypothetical protein
MTINTDFTLVDGGADIGWAEGVDAVVESVFIGAHIFRGTWRYDLRAGLPYFSDVFEKSPNLALIRADFADMLLKTPEVTTIYSLSMQIDSDRTLRVKYSVGTTFEKTVNSTMQRDLI